MGSVEGWRDVLVSIAVMLWTVLVIVIAAVFFFAQRYTGRGFAALDRLFKRRLRPALHTAQGQVQQLRNLAGGLPGGTPLIEGSAVPPRRKGKRLALPFKKKRRLPIPFLR